MHKSIKNVFLCFLCACIIWAGFLIADRKTLNDELIRLHIVANSDSAEDQSIKMQVKTVIAESLKEALQDVSDVEEAKQWIAENISFIQQIANEALIQAGSSDNAIATLCKEVFDTRYYETFSLPAGVYHALKITIGEGEGKNWWCVAFPSLCIPITAEGFETVAAGAGFSETLNNTLLQKDGYEIRFFVLDMIGRMENIFFTE